MKPRTHSSKKISAASKAFRSRVLSLERLEERVVLASEFSTTFVERSHVGLFNRSATPAEITAIGDALDRTGDRGAAARRMANSAEFRQRLVRDAFRQILDRGVAPSVLAAQSNFLARGGTLDALYSSLLLSREFSQRMTNGSNRSFIEALYRKTLGREVRAAELTAALRTL